MSRDRPEHAHVTSEGTRWEAKAVIEQEVAREIFLDAMEEGALAVAGVVMVHRIDDEALWKLMRGLDNVRRRNLARLGDAAGEADCMPEIEPGPSAHPAIEEFLVRLQRARKQPA